MSFKYRVPLFCFLAVTILSLGILSYTLYIALGTKWALTSLSVTVSSVTINAINETASTADFKLVIRNPSSVHLSMFYLRTDAKFNGTALWPPGELNFEGHPLGLQANAETEVTVTISVGNSTSYSNGFWNLTIRIIFDTALPKQPSVTREVTYGG